MKFISALLGIIFLLFLIIFIGELLFEKLYPTPKQISYGVTFSPKYATDLGEDWKDIYIKMLDDLKVKNLRIPTYWDVLEKSKDNFDATEVDFMVGEASKKGANIILVLGARQPRWPECYIPSWAKNLSVSDRQKMILQFIKKVVEHYKDNPTIWGWQIENEPFLTSFGKGCDNPDAKFLQAEVSLVRSLSNKQIILTDSGELGFWIIPMKLSDIFGTTLYREVYNSILGYTTYPLPPYFYNLKSKLIRQFFAQNNQKTIIVELQAEPWSQDNNLMGMPIEKQFKLLSEDKFKQYVEYANQTGFDRIYLWGVEWWYFMEKQGHPQYLQYAKSLFK